MNGPINAPAKHQLTHILLHLLVFTSLSSSFHTLYMYSPLPSEAFSSLSLPQHSLPFTIFSSLSLLKLKQTEMERERSTKQASLLMWTLVAALLSQNLLIPVMSITSVADQKNYYSPDPNTQTPPTGSHGSPSHGSGGGGHGTPSHGGGYGSAPPAHGNPSHGGGYGSAPPSHGTPSHGGGYGSTPPSHGTPSNGGGGGSHGGSPPANCGTPPSGGHYDPSPAPPTGGGGYYDPPPSSGDSPPTPIIETPPVTTTPPTSPISYPGTPSSPGISIPTPPFAFDPNSPPFTCNYWRTHPGLVWGLLGWFGTVGGAFGVASVPGFGAGANLSLQQALANARTDGFGALYREGTASLLNSMVDKRFPFTPKQVRDNFISAISSNKAAATQAKVFKLANEGRLKPRT